MDRYELHATLAAPIDVEDLCHWVERERDYGYEYRLLRIENFCRDGTSRHELIATYTDKWERFVDAQEQLDCFGRGAKETGFSILRNKIECEPYHSGAIQSGPPVLYWESHTKASISMPEEAWRLGFHVSRVGDKPQLTLTLRSNTLTRADFELDLALRLHYLMNSGVLIGKTHVEYCLVDTNPTLDDQWLKT